MTGPVVKIKPIEIRRTSVESILKKTGSITDIRDLLYDPLDEVVSPLYEAIP